MGDVMDETWTLAEKATNELLCAGCVCGSGTEGCDQYAPQKDAGCDSWSPGTTILGVGRIALGFPRGFNKALIRAHRTHWLALTPERRASCLLSDDFNMPVWHKREGDWTFVKVAQPRLGFVTTYALDKTPDELQADGFDIGRDVSDLEMD